MWLSNFEKEVYLSVLLKLKGSFLSKQGMVAHAAYMDSMKGGIHTVNIVKKVIL